MDSGSPNAAKPQTVLIEKINPPLFIWRWSVSSKLAGARNVGCVGGCEQEARCDCPSSQERGRTPQTLVGTAAHSAPINISSTQAHHQIQSQAQDLTQT